MSHQTQREKQAHGLAYTLGVTSTFVAIAIVMLSLRAAGEAIGWGFPTTIANICCGSNISILYYGPGILRLFRNRKQA